MAFAVHIDMVNCTSCNNSVVACPVDALEFHTVDQSSSDKIFKVGDGIVLNFKSELCTDHGVCVQACPLDVIKLTEPRESRAQANVL
jgi:4Fe-4S ferredoxin